MYWYCCFFFKQKTAYEMRISDWSSDVCSSDLQDGVFIIQPIGRGQPDVPPHQPCEMRFPAMLEAHQHLARQIVIDDGGSGSGKNGPVLHTRGAERIVTKDERKLGRASWRERGCQYVSI